MKRRGPRSRGHAALSVLAVSPPKQESTSCLSQTLMSRSLFLHIRNSSAVKNNRWWCWWRSVLFLLLFDPECSVNKGQWLQQFTGCSQSSTEVSNICCLTVASSAGVCWSLWAAPTITTQRVHRKLKMTCICFWEVEKVCLYVWVSREGLAGWQSGAGPSSGFSLSEQTTGQRWQFPSLK